MALLEKWKECTDVADELDALLERVDDAGLRSELQSHIERLRRRREFGLVFESHLPERVRLPEHPIRRGSKVVRRDAPPKETPQEVLRVKGKKAVLAADGDEGQVACDDLVVVAEFGEPIYPGLRRLGSIDRGGDKPAHVVIKGENYHALEALRFSHAGKIDCIYIDPPYNTGARDWKYDNDYVDADDGYRHSKWLAFMERRLRLSRDLLADDSVLIVTIDEKEVHRLGLLIDQLFPDAVRQMVTIVINPSGTSREHLSRVEEYALFVFLGDARPTRVPDNLLTQTEESELPSLNWESLLRRGNRWYRSERPNLCYPIGVDPETKRIEYVGEPFEGEDEAERPTTRGDLQLAWPVRTDGRLGIWRKDGSGLRQLVDRGFAHVTRWDSKRETWTIKYLMSGTVEAIESGQILVERTGAAGEVEAVGGTGYGAVPKTVWNRSSHNAGVHGSGMVSALLPGRSFPFPKSLYAVEDALRTAILARPHAIVLDFFAGSGTTAHAVARLNRQDGAHRQSISITNNEVSAEEAVRLRAEGSRPGDQAWEKLGIFENVTRPRVAAAITGKTPSGTNVEGQYRFGDEFSMAEGFEENVEFLELRYLDIEDVELDRAFEAVAPLLWLRAGATGEVIGRRCDDSGAPKQFDHSDRYGVLFDPDHWRAFVEKLPETVTSVFVVTDSPSVFASVAAELPPGVDVVRLYENYLSTFAINRGR